RGMPRARIALPEIDGRSESVGESISRLIFVEAGLPRPELQREFVIDGRLYRSDFYWEDEEVIGEFDGLGKYLDETSESGRRASLRAEKQRDQDFQSVGITPVHWTMGDLATPSALVSRVRRAFRH
ncbi:MAG: hypothetical protein Q4G67_15295, partial [Actinomycetia bacterium]|nr:hypothetical protein [Actinomycetes bacterium]